MQISNQENQAKCQIQIRGLVAEFVQYCRQTRPKFSYDTWRRAFRESQRDSLLLEWTRKQAVDFMQEQNALTASPTPPQMVAAEAA